MDIRHYGTQIDDKLVRAIPLHTAQIYKLLDIPINSWICSDFSLDVRLDFRRIADGFCLNGPASFLLQIFSSRYQERDCQYAKGRSRSAAPNRRAI
jgi:hypothetical protein